MSRPSRFLVDFGNTNWKVRSDKQESELTVPHAIIEIGEAAWNQNVKRANGKPPKDYAYIKEMNMPGRYFAFGEAAERQGTVERRVSAAKFTLDYFGVGLAYLAARIFKSSRSLVVFASHAPGDIDYRENLLDAAGNCWEIKIEDRDVEFEIEYINTFEEPTGGLMNVVLNKDGTDYENPIIAEGRTLVIDIGGGTVDLAAMYPKGRVDYSLQLSIPVGFNNVYDDFVRQFRQVYAREAQQLRVLPADRIRAAIRTGEYSGGGRSLPCEDIANGATNRLLNEIKTAYYTRAGGPLAWDHILLTGGGPVPLYERLLPILNHASVHKAETSDEYMHLANIRGGLKYLYMLETLGAVRYG